MQNMGPPPDAPPSRRENITNGFSRSLLRARSFFRVPMSKKHHTPTDGRGASHNEREDHTVHSQGQTLATDLSEDEGRPLSTALSNRIPIEIYENIIEHTDRDMLRSAALVCRAWYPRASQSLYHTVIIESRASYGLLTTQLRTSPRISHWLAYTHELVIGRYRPSDSNIPFLDALPLVFAQALPALRVLEIRRSLRPAMHPSFYVALRQFQHLTSLHLCLVKLSNTAQLRRIVCAFPSLEELTLENVTFVQAQSSGATVRNVALVTHPEIRLRRLKLRGYHDGHIQSFDPIVTWLVSSKFCGSLLALVMDFDASSPLDAIRELATKQVDRLLGASGPSLVSFHGEIYLWLHDHSPCSFAHNTALRHLALKLNFHFGSSVEDSDWPDAANELRAAFSTIRSHQLEDIAVHLRFEFSSRLSEEELSHSYEKLDSDSRSLHEVLVRPYFVALTDVGVKVEVFHMPDDYKSADDFARVIVPICRRLFTPWDNRGIVNVSYYTTQA